MRGPAGCIVLSGLRDVLLHQLRQHLVLALELLLQSRDALLVIRGPCLRLPLKDRRPVLKEELLPPVELRRREAHFLAQNRYRRLLHQNAAEVPEPSPPT